MSIRPFRDIKRRKTKVINVGDVKIGGDNPISVQSMTNTLTTDTKATIKQINSIHNEGADLVRVSCPDQSSSQALKEIIKYVNIPIIASNRINSPEIAEEILSEKCADLVSLARPFLADSDFVKKARENKYRLSF